MSKPALQADELVQLSRELEAMLRAGVPLDLGLESVSGGLAPDLQQVSNRLAQRISSGASLAEALADEPRTPAFFREAVAAGIRCGRAEEALSHVASITESLAGLRKTLRHGMIYPLLCFILGGLLLTVLSQTLLPEFLKAAADLAQKDGPAIEPAWFSWLPTTLSAIGLGVATAASAGLIFVLRPISWRPSALKLIPGAGRLLKDLETSRTAYLLGLLTSYQVPLPEALGLAAQTETSDRWRHDLSDLQRSVERGQGLDEAVSKQTGVPRFLKWLIVSGGTGPQLGATLLQAAEFYQRRAWRRAELLQVLVPALALVVLGCGISLLASASLVFPFKTIWNALNTP